MPRGRHAPSHRTYRANRAAASARPQAGCNPHRAAGHLPAEGRKRSRPERRPAGPLRATAALVRPAAPRRPDPSRPGSERFPLSRFKRTSTIRLPSLRLAAVAALTALLAGFVLGSPLAETRPDARAPTRPPAAPRRPPGSQRRGAGLRLADANARRGGVTCSADSCPASSGLWFSLPDLANLTGMAPRATSSRSSAPLARDCCASAASPPTRRWHGSSPECPRPRGRDRRSARNSSRVCAGWPVAVAGRLC